MSAEICLGWQTAWQCSCQLEKVDLSQDCHSCRIWTWQMCKVEKVWCTSLCKAPSLCEDADETTSYFVLRFATGEAQDTLVLAKTRVAPVRTPIVPRIELPAATVAINMDKLLIKELQKSFFWTDSTAELKYLNSEKTWIQHIRCK